MASLMEEFINVLEQEEVKYAQLVEVSRSKTDTIIYSKIDALQDITEQEQLLLEEIGKLDHQRRTLRKDMSSVLNIKVEELTLLNLADMFKTRPEDQQRLMDLREKLRLTLIEVAKINKENDVLLKQALEMLEFDMTLVKSMKQAPTTANYTNKAYSAEVQLPQGGFDTKS